MANEISILGLVEFYDVEKFKEIKLKLSEHETLSSFDILSSVNLTISRGSILMPFAKTINADLEEQFIVEELKKLLLFFSFTQILSMDVYINNIDINRFIMVYNEGQIIIEKFKCELIKVNS
ncbi:MAG TPA: hypothetical protein VEY10_02720 [Flavisolibacter sp.]|jgi:hypothetical protein|nr:hypothetical protein [Flavisolibacter sp.]